MPQKKHSKIFVLCLFLISTQFYGCGSKSEPILLSRSFDGGYGQLEVGGSFVGAEFHGSRPLPSRLSFYYPVANSLDLSTDYWKRYNSNPLQILLHSRAGVDTLGMDAWTYTYGPTFAKYTSVVHGHSISLQYQFGEALPMMAMTLDIDIGQSTDAIDSIEIAWDLSIRTSHAYRWITELIPESTSEHDFAVSYPDSGADFSSLFISNISDQSATRKLERGAKPRVVFMFNRREAQTYNFKLTQLIGMCPSQELEALLPKLRRDWQSDILNYEKRVLNYAMVSTNFKTGDDDLQETVYWSKALLATNRHYIDGRIMPMPCPAEYNFFFTHDLLHTGQGAVNYELAYLQHGFRFLLELTQPDNILPHAYYWREGKFVTEFCNSDNWNHLWFIISAASYLKHSADTALVDSLYPILERSLELMSENLGADGLMYAQRPDWWDIGDVYGARSYTTILMSKALKDFVFISSELNKNLELMPDYLAQAARLKQELVNQLWDEDAGYLMNILDQNEVDNHYYTGSIVAVVYDMLEPALGAKLLNTVKDVLLDEQLGVRNAMPPDFHLLGERYHFQGNEAGAQWVYFNGGVWPQGNAWYVKALQANGQSEEALNVLRKYMTIAGILDSPNGLPSFYEYRRTDPESPRYGEIDKPSFLWAGGFYLQSLYQLAGAREDDWNQYLDVNIPVALTEAEFDLMIQGVNCRVTNTGIGDWFEEIEVDGVISHSAVLTQPAKMITVKRGKLTRPYLAAANCKITIVSLDGNTMTLAIEGIPGRAFQLHIASPIPVSGASMVKEDQTSASLDVEPREEGYFDVQGNFEQSSASISVLLTK